VSKYIYIHTFVGRFRVFCRIVFCMAFSAIRGTFFEDMWTLSKNCVKNFISEITDVL